MLETVLSLDPSNLGSRAISLSRENLVAVMNKAKFVLNEMNDDMAQSWLDRRRFASLRSMIYGHGKRSPSCWKQRQRKARQFVVV